MSTLTIELDSLTEDRLQERSRREGRQQAELAAHLLANAVSTGIFFPVLSCYNVPDNIKKCGENRWPVFFSGTFTITKH